jgi:hypothetical protein
MVLAHASCSLRGEKIRRHGEDGGHSPLNASPRAHPPCVPQPRPSRVDIVSARIPLGGNSPGEGAGLTRGSCPPSACGRTAARLRRRRLHLVRLDSVATSPAWDVGHAPNGFRRRRPSNPAGRPRAARKRISRPTWWNSVTTLRRHLPSPRQPRLQPSCAAQLVQE